MEWKDCFENRGILLSVDTSKDLSWTLKNEYFLYFLQSLAQKNGFVIPTFVFSGFLLWWCLSDAKSAQNIIDARCQECTCYLIFCFFCLFKCGKIEVTTKFTQRWSFFLYFVSGDAKVTPYAKVTQNITVTQK